MNYRHIFHAGNFGDVLKHALLFPLLRSMQRKEKGFLFLDTHAGTGAYDLRSSKADRTGEFVDGIEKLWKLAAPPEQLRDYVDLVRRFNLEQGGTPESLRHYPGSPIIGAMLLRPQDRLALSELHPDDFASLRDNMSAHRGVSVQRIDAYSALRAFIPPPERRALVLIDPPYEDHDEAARLSEGLAGALERFPSGVFAVWYPIKDRASCDAFRSVLLTLPLPPTLAVELTVRADNRDDRLNGSGLVVINPPWKIEEEIVPILSALRDLLALDSGARGELMWLRTED